MGAAEKFRMAAAAHTQFNRREKALVQLMSDVSVQADRGDATALVESIEQLQEESCLLDTEMPKLKRVDPALGEKAEQLRMAANRSATKGKSTLRRLTSEDGYSSANSQVSSKGEKEKNPPLSMGLWPLTEAEHKARLHQLAGGAKERPRPNLVEEERLFLQDL